MLCFVLLFISAQQGGLSLLLGGNWGRGEGEGRIVCSHLCSCVYSSLSRTVWGPSFPWSLCPLGETLFDIPVGFTREGQNEPRVAIQSNLEGGREEG